MIKAEFVKYNEKKDWLTRGYFEITGIDFEKLYEIFSRKGVYIESKDGYQYEEFFLEKDNNSKGPVYLFTSNTGLDCYSDFVFIENCENINWKSIIGSIESILSKN